MQTHEILFDQRISRETSLTAPQLDISTNHEQGKTIMSDQEPATVDPNEDRKIKFQDWGFKVDRLFEVAFRFYKRNENKAFHLSFDERNRMTALIMQAKFGNFGGDRVPDVGVLDLVGKRRQQEWSLLAGMTKTEAMTKFICELDEVCPIFKAHAEAVKISSNIELTNGNHKNGLENGSKQSGHQSIDPSLIESDAQMSGIYSSLCKQTHSQFKSYAEKQYPEDATKQRQLITSLQEQYYQQYISQMNPKLREGKLNDKESVGPDNNINPSMQLPITSNISTTEPAIGSNPGNEAIGICSQAMNETTSANSSVSKDTNASVGIEQFERHIEANPVMSDINCDEDNVQADISCEELNSELDFDTRNSVHENSREVQVRHSTSTNRSNSLTPSFDEQSRTLQLNFVETATIDQNLDSTPIGAFESFPEPRLVRNSNSKKPDTMTIDPNLPSKPVRSEIEVHDDKESNDKITPSKEELTSKNDTEPETVMCPLNLDQVGIGSSNIINEIQNKTQEVIPPLAFHNLDESYQAATTTIDVHETVMNEPSSAVCELIEPSSHNGSNQLASWAPMDSTHDCNSMNMQSNFNYEPLEPATIWTKKAVAEFKDSLGGDRQGGVYEVKEGALIVIQVPTYPDGKYIYWEFATDNYDIGFGVDFIHASHLSEPLALNIYQDDDEDDLEDFVEPDGLQDMAISRDGCESWEPRLISDRDRLKEEKRKRLANTISILPTYRRDSHDEVYVGRHKYPGQGYYLLKFDNTYSVLRSKTLYFRICYFM